jgi:hypothetical protein
MYPGTGSPMARRIVCALIVLSLAGCGEDEQATAEPTAASTAQECFELWNEHEELGTAGQTTPADILADVAPTPALVEFRSGECHVVAPVGKGSSRAYVWVAPGGRAPYGHATQLNVPNLEFNARGLKTGKLDPVN